MLEKLKLYLPLILLLLVSLVGYHAWLSFGTFFHADWWQFSYTSILHTSYVTTWSSSGLGLPNVTFSRFPVEAVQYWLSTLLHVGSNVTDKLLFFWPIIILTPLAGYSIAKVLTRKRWIAAIGGTVFAFNTYFLAINSEGDELITLAASLCAIGLTMYLKSGFDKLPLLILSTLCLYFASIFDFRIVYIFFFLFLFYSLINFSKESIRAFLLVGCFLLVLCLAWVLPLEAASSLTNNMLFARGLFGDNFWNLPSALTLFHPFWTGQVPSWFVPQSVPLYFWILPAIAISGLILLPRTVYLFFFAFIGIVGILLTKQVAPPFVNLYEWLYIHLPGFNAFREASKFYILIIISYSAITVTLLSALTKSGRAARTKQIGYGVGCVVLCIFIFNLKPLVSNNIGTLFQQRHVSHEYVQINQLLGVSGSFFRSLWLPTTSPWVNQSDNHPVVGAASLQDNWKSDLGTPSNLPIERKLVDEFGEPYSNILLSAASIKYIVVPLRDTANDGDFFQAYGDDRQYFINALNNVSFLKRINIGTKTLAIYENTSVRPYITAVKSVYGINSNSEIPTQLPILNKYFSSDFYIPKSGVQQRAGTGMLQSLFEPQDGDPNRNGKLEEQVTLRPNTYLYTDNNTRNLFYKISSGTLLLYEQQLGGLKLNDKTIDNNSQSVQWLAQATLSPKSIYYIGMGSQLQRVDQSQSGRQNLGDVSDTTTLYGASPKNLVPNPSFEYGLWQKYVQDCNAYDAHPDISMGLSSDTTDGKRSLKLEATSHTACTDQQNIPVQAGMTYLFRFDYKNQGGQKAGYKITFDDPKHTSINQDLYINNKNWRTEMRSITVPTGASHASIQVYGYPDENFKNDSLTYYDNVRMSQITPQFVISPPDGGLQKTALPSGQASFTYQDAMYPMQNLIPNGSLEHGLWQKQVGDCNNYDSNPQISMQLNNNASDGKQSLELEASRHIACTGPSAISVNANSTYLLSFDYQSPDSASASYSISYNDPAGTTVSQSISANGTGWHHYVTSVQMPPGSSSLSLLVYASPHGYNNAKSIVRYDNFKLTEIPDVLNYHYIITQATRAITLPKHVGYNASSPTKKVIHVTDATTPFYLAMSESYNPKWRLELNNAKVNGPLRSWLPSAHANAVPASDHIDLNDFENGWYIDPAQLCKNHAAGCTRNADGSYDIQLVAEFTPQRWFYAGSIISGITFIGCIGYLGRYYYKRRLEGKGVHYVARR
jgi:hypothetical protein